MFSFFPDIVNLITELKIRYIYFLLCLLHDICFRNNIEEEEKGINFISNKNKIL